MSLVVDASVTLPWMLPDESTPIALAKRARVIKEGGLVPQHWRLEICNGLLMAARRRRYNLAHMNADLEALAGLPILVDPHTNDASWEETAALARSFKLTAYDAAYLELARRNGLHLATFDAELAKAARKAGVKVV